MVKSNAHLSGRTGKAERREQILDAACRLFALKGYDAVKTKEIADEVGCSESLLFRYFTTKNDIYMALFDEWAQVEMLPVELEIIEDSPLKTLEKFFDSLYYGVHLSKPHKRPDIITAVCSRKSIDDEVSKVIRSSPNIITSTLLPVMIKGIECGEIRQGDPLEIAQDFWITVCGLSFINNIFPLNRIDYTFDRLAGLIFKDK